MEKAKTKTKKTLQIVFNVIIWLFVVFAVVVTILVIASQSDSDGVPSLGGKCFICNSNCPETAAEVQRAVEEAFPRLRGKTRICDIGTIIASHCGPGTVAVFFLGDERAPEGAPV